MWTPALGPCIKEMLKLLPDRARRIVVIRADHGSHGEEHNHDSLSDAHKAVGWAIFALVWLQVLLVFAMPFAPIARSVHRFVGTGTLLAVLGFQLWSGGKALTGWTTGAILMVRPPPCFCLELDLYRILTWVCLQCFVLFGSPGVCRADYHQRSGGCLLHCSADCLSRLSQVSQPVAHRAVRGLVVPSGQ